MSDYLIVKVESKRPDYWNRWHGRVTGKKCEIECLWLGKRAEFKIFGLKPWSEFTRFHTSPVCNATVKDGLLYIYTRNSVYVLEEVDGREN